MIKLLKVITVLTGLPLILIGFVGGLIVAYVLGGIRFVDKYMDWLDNE